METCFRCGEVCEWRTCACGEFRLALGFKGSDADFDKLWSSFKRYCEASDEPESLGDHIGPWIATEPLAQEYS